jgi:hypothetical protein
VDIEPILTQSGSGEVTSPCDRQAPHVPCSMRRILPAMLGAAFALAPAAADACSCGVPSLCTRYARSAAVLAVRVLEVIHHPGRDRKEARVEVLRAYKGDAVAGTTVTLVMPGGSPASCSLDLEPGERLVVFAGGSNGTYGTHLCAGNIPLRRGAPFPVFPPEPGAVVGELVRSGPPGDRSYPPIVGARVWVEAAGRRVEARTDAHGRFRLPGLPPGRYVVRFDAGAAGRDGMMIELRAPDDCYDVFMPLPLGPR